MHTAPHYEIRIRGVLGPTLLEAFPGLTPGRDAGDTLLTGVVQDQAALFGVLHSIEALGLELLELRVRDRPPCALTTRELTKERTP